MSSTLSADTTTPDGGAGNGTPRMRHLDGVRATAALYVLVHHAFMSAHLVDARGEVHGWESIAFGWAQWGHFGVTVFIALAGFSLGMPVGRTGVLPEGFWGFVKRRARRIIPPYWIALTVTILLAVTVLGRHTGTREDLSLPITPRGWAADYVLMQDVIPVRDAAYTLWSVAVEWHIYLVLPLMVLLWRFVGLAPAVLACAACGAIGMLGDAFVDDRIGRFFPEYYLVFALAAGAAIAIRRAPAMVARTPWRLAAGAAAVVVIGVCSVASTRWIIANTPWLDVVLGLGVVAALTAMTTGRALRLRQVFSWGPLALAAGFSYSLYLIHAQLLELFYLVVVEPLHVSPDDALALFWLVACPVIVGIAWTFSLVAEKPFLPPPRVPQPQPTRATSDAVA
ncbi:MAG: acyltransferase [Gordonia paraffinivorans]